MKSRALVPAGRMPAHHAQAGMPSSLREQLRYTRPRYHFANGVFPATFDKFGTWRNTGEPAAFFVSILDDGVTTHTERFVWVYRRGVMVEVEQFGIRHGRRKFVGWSK